jgi:GDPmannose 4,6-dehydratase
MLQKKTPQDYVISTGKQYSVRDFVNLVLKELKILIKITLLTALIKILQG